MARIKLKDGNREIEIEGNEPWVERKLKDFLDKEKKFYRLSIYANP